MPDQTFPRTNLNAAAAPWARRVEKLLLDAAKRLEQIESGLGGTQDTAVRALRRLGANPDIYRDEGILAFPGNEFAIYSGDQRDDGSGYFGSLNVLPNKSMLRYANDDGDSAYVLAGGQDDGPTGAVVAIGIGNGLRYNDFYEGMRGFELSLDSNGNPQVRLATSGLPVLTLGYEAPTQNQTGSFDQHPYMQWGDDVDHRIYGFGDIVAAGRPATVDQTGIVQLATDDETAALQSTTKAVTPHGLARALAQNGGGGGGGGGSNLVDVYRGTYDASTTYERGDLVLQGNLLWLSLVEQTGQPPQPFAQWEPFAVNYEVDPNGGSGGGGTAPETPLYDATIPSDTTSGWVRNGDAQWGDLSVENGALKLVSSYNQQFVRYWHQATVPPPIDLAPFEITYDLYIESQNAAGMSAGMVMTNNGDRGYAVFRIDVNSDLSIGCRFEQDGEANVVNIPAAGPFQLDSWHTIRFVRHGRAAIAYIDGEYVLGTDQGTSNIGYAASVMMFGGQVSGATARYRNIHVTAHDGIGTAAEGGTTAPSNGGGGSSTTTNSLPVRASQTNPFAAGEAGLWIVLNADGSTADLRYENGQ